MELGIVAAGEVPLNRVTRAIMMTLMENKLYEGATYYLGTYGD